MKQKMKLFPAILTLFLVLGVGPTLLIALFAIPYHAQLGTYRLVVSVLLILSVVSTLCLAGLITRLLKRPINQLLEAQKQVRHGNLDCRLPVEGNQELCLLFDGFNKMAEGVENAAKQEQQLAEQRSFNKLASQVVHDLRSPLATLKTAAQYLSSQSSQAMEGAELKKVATLIQLGTKRLEEIAEELLAQKRAVTASVDKIELHGVLSELLLEFEAKTNTTGPVFEKDFHPQSIHLSLEKKDLQRIVSNILNNAVEALSGRGKVICRTFFKKGIVFLQIEDNGPGMTEEILQKVLRGGFTYGKTNGNGIGMTVVREMVEKYKGKMEASSTVGLGTIFTIGFPQ